MFKLSAFVSCVLIFPLCAQLSEEELKKRIYNHILIHDTISAVKEARSAFELYPESKIIQLALIDALCENGNEIDAFEQWQRTVALFQEEKTDRRMLEILAWGVLHKGEGSAQLNSQLNALIGAAFTRDAKAIPLLIEQLHNSNALLRSVAVKLCCNFGDTPLKNEIARMLKDEKVWYVRLEVIQAVGALRLVELKPMLKEIIGNPKTLVEEKAAAIIALVSMYDSIGRNELLRLVKSDRAGLRQLASEVIAHLSHYADLDLLLPLLHDNSSDVRVSTLNTLSLLRVHTIKEQPIAAQLEKSLQDHVPEVAITAAYALLILENKKGEQAIETWLHSSNPEWRRLASAALAASGKYGIRLSLRELKESQDPYVKVNLAMGLIGQRVQLKESSEVIYTVFSQEKSQLWMWDNHANPLFRSLAPSNVKHIEQIPHYPIVIDQLVRLDLLSMLSIVRYPKAQEAVKGFLQTRAWGVTGAAAATLLQEGDETALEAVRSLLDDPDQHIRLQAAMIMTMVGNDLTAVKVLQEIYSQVDREMKMHILEAIAHVGDPTSIPFLLDILKEPFQVLRFVAASALIQCLSH